MPDYLAPDDYIQEAPFPGRAIQGVGTTTTGFIGPTRYGPLNLSPGILTSLSDLERVYGDGQRLAFADGGVMHNYMWHAVRAFFEEGGKRLYVVRTFRATRDPANPDQVQSDGYARAMLPSAATANPEAQPADPIEVRFPRALHLRARFPGSPGNVRLRFSVRVEPDTPDHARVITLTVAVLPSDMNDVAQVWDALSLHPDADMANVGEKPGNPAETETLPIVITFGRNITTDRDVLDALLAEYPLVAAALMRPDSTDDERSLGPIELTGGNDGDRPTRAEYEGEVDPGTNRKTGLRALEDVEEISIISAPGATFGYESTPYRAEASAIVNLLTSHAERLKYRIALLDSGDGQSISEVQTMRGQVDSTYAALYYPWVRILDPVTRAEVYLPPSGFVAGIYARHDAERGVHSAPANEVVKLATGLEQAPDGRQREMLNREGINCLRPLPGQGIRLWGARTVSSDPEWRYVNVRRYLIYLEHSIDRGTQWTVFEPNDETLWSDVRRSIEDFLFSEWRAGGLLGDKPEVAFFVRCDRTTMTQDDIDNGRLVCLIGVAAVRPAEFIIFRIGQWTADRKQ